MSKIKEQKIEMLKNEITELKGCKFFLIETEAREIVTEQIKYLEQELKELENEN